MTGSYYLIQLAAGSGNGVYLPFVPNIVGAIGMGATNFKLALVYGTASISGLEDETVIDFLGAGTANEFEGEGKAPAGSNSESVKRKNFVDTNENAADFEAITANLNYLQGHLPNVITYTVTFDYNCEEISNEAVKVVENNKVTKPSNPLRTGYEFKGWFINLLDEQSFDFDTLINSNLTLVAKWEEAELDLTKPFELASAKDSTAFQGDHTEKFNLDSSIFEVNVTGGNLGHYSELRTYKGTQIKIGVKTGYEITKIEFDFHSLPDAADIMFDGNLATKETLSGTKTIYDSLHNEYFEIINNGAAVGSSIKLNKILITISKVKELTVEEKLILAIEELNIKYSGSDNENTVTSNITLPEEGLYGANISWQSSESNITSEGIVTRPEYGEGHLNVTLIATITLGELEETKEFNLIVLEKEDSGGEEPQEPESYTEDFETQTALTASYANGSFVGTGGVTFTYGHSRNEDTYGINNKGFMLRRASDSYIEFVLPNGLERLQFDYRKAFTGGTNNRQLEIIINGVVVHTTNMFGPSGEDSTIHHLDLTGLDYTGPTTIRIKSPGTATGNAQITLDNISWTEGPKQ